MKTATNAILFSISFILFSSFPADAVAECRLYHLRVTLRSGDRYETISSHDPVNYCHMHGGSVIYLRDYSLIFSPQMKVKLLRTWLATDENLGEHFADVLGAHGMLAHGNHKRLRRVRPLTMQDMLVPE